MLVLSYSIGLLFSCGVFALGRWMKLNPSKAERIFWWMPRMASGYFKIVGPFFMIGGIVGVSFYFIAIVVHII